jgi:transposase-like protein
MIFKCPRCKNKKFWKLSDGRLKCNQCKHRFSKYKDKLRIKPKLLMKIVEEFLLEHSTNIILSRVKISKYKLLKLLTLLRIIMTKNVPDVFSGILEVDEAYLGGQMKNRKQKNRIKYSKNRRGFGTIKQPFFGILCRERKVYAEIVPDIEAKNLQPLIKKQVNKGSIICSNSWIAYTGLAAKGYVHRIVEHNKNKYSDKKGNHIRGIIIESYH